MSDLERKGEKAKFEGKARKVVVGTITGDREEESRGEWDLQKGKVKKAAGELVKDWRRRRSNPQMPTQNSSGKGRSATEPRRVCNENIVASGSAKDCGKGGIDGKSKGREFMTLRLT